MTGCWQRPSRGCLGLVAALSDVPVDAVYCVPYRYRTSTGYRWQAAPVVMWPMMGDSGEAENGKDAWEGGCEKGCGPCGGVERSNASFHSSPMIHHGSMMVPVLTWSHYR
jgi:hypothetical protein